MTGKYIMDHLIMIETSTCLNTTYKTVNDAEKYNGSLISKTDPKRYQLNMMEKDGSTLQTQVPAYRMSPWLIATYKVEWYQLAATRATVKWTNECWYNLRSSPTAVVHFFTMGINDLKSTMWEIVWLPATLTNARLLTDNDNERQGTQYKLTSVNKWAEVEHL